MRVLIGRPLIRVLASQPPVPAMLTKLRNAVVRSGLPCKPIKFDPKLKTYKFTSDSSVQHIDASNNLHSPKLSGWFKGLAQATSSELVYDKNTHGHKQVSLVQKNTDTTCHVILDHAADTGEIVFTVDADALDEKPAAKQETQPDDGKPHLPPKLAKLYLDCRRPPASSKQLLLMREAWTYFNHQVFGGRLKPAHMRLMRTVGAERKHTLGTWSAGTRTLSIQPTTFKGPLATFVETFVHEMCHQAVTDINQTRDSGPGGHGPLWSAWMRKCGLSPNSFMTINRDEFMDTDEKEAYRQKIAEREAQRQKADEEQHKYRHMWSPQDGKPAIARINDKYVEGILVCPSAKDGRTWAFIERNSVYSNRFWRVPADSLYEWNGPPEDAEKIRNDSARSREQIRNHLQAKSDRRSQMKALRNIFGRL